MADKKPNEMPSQVLPAGEGYVLLETIGSGEYGEVFRARAPGGFLVAVKRMFGPMDDEASQKELKALDKLRELRHPFLLQTHSFQTFNRRLVIVMELADGSLQDRFKQCKEAGLPGIPARELLNYFTEAAEALDFLRQEKLAHRDIKPQNLLHLKGHAKVADFGIARKMDNALVHTMNASGTPPYMPPEVWGGEISVHSDQYSFAVTWYELRTGGRLFPGKRAVEISQQHLNAKPDVSGVPDAEGKVLLKALAKKPDKRFPTCAAFVEALKEAIAPSTQPAAGKGTGPKVVLISLALALALALGVIAVLLVVWLR